MLDNQVSRFVFQVKKLELMEFEPMASYMRSKHSTTEPGQRITTKQKPTFIRPDVPGFGFSDI